jgi:hypothetical protein
VSWQQNTSAAQRSSSVTIAGNTFSVTQAGQSAAGGTEWLMNGGFESAPGTGNTATAWNIWPVSGHSLIVANGPFPRGGTNYASLGGSDNTNSDIISQNFVIPSDATAASVSCWLNIVTDESIGQGVYDNLSIGLYNLDGSWVANVVNVTNEDAAFSNNTNGTYFHVGPFDVSAYRGTTLQLAFIGFTDSILPTTFRIDDVSLLVTKPDSVPTVSISSPANGATVSGTVNISASASDDVAVTSLEINIDGITHATTASSSVVYAWNTLSVANGVHTIVAKAGDGAGHFTTSSAVTVTVSNAVTLPAPANVAATATSPSQVNVTWSPVNGAASYQVFRRSGPGAFTLVGTTAATAYPDSSVSANTAYLYQVRAADAGNNLGLTSNVDLATTVVFADDPLAAASSVVKAVHITSLRAAVDAVRALAGLSAATYSTTIGAGSAVRATDITELRARLTEARSAAGLGAASFTNGLSAGVSIIRSVDVMELRAGVK